MRQICEYEFTANAPFRFNDAPFDKFIKKIHTHAFFFYEIKYASKKY